MSLLQGVVYFLNVVWFTCRSEDVSLTDRQTTAQRSRKQQTEDVKEEAKLDLQYADEMLQLVELAETE